MEKQHPSHPAQHPGSECSSPPCYAHEVDPAYMGLEPDPGIPSQQKDDAERAEAKETK